MRRFLPVVPVALAALMAASSLPAAAAEEEDAPPPLSEAVAGVSLDESTNLLSGTVEPGTPVADVLRKIGMLAGIELKVGADPGPTEQEVVLDSMPPDLAVERLVKGYSWVICYGPLDQGQRHIRKVILVGSGDSAFSGSMPAITGSVPVSIRRPQPTGRMDVEQLGAAADSRSIAELRHRAENAEDPAERRAALNALAEAAGRRSIPVLERRLHDPDGEVRVEAARLLLQIDPAARARVAAVARFESDRSVRETLQGIVRGEGQDGQDGQGTQDGTDQNQ